MITKQLDPFLIQETWLTGNWEKEIRGYLVIHHNHEKDKFEKERTREKRRSNCAITIFSKSIHRCWLTKIHQNFTEKGIFSGRFVGITLKFPNTNSYGKRLKGNTKYFVASVYHPHENKIYRQFNDTLTTILSKVPKSAHAILEQDINANIGIRGDDDDDFSNIIGPHGIDNKNLKGVWALQWLSMMNLRASNSFFKHNDYTSHTSFLTPDSPQMLNVFSLSITIFKGIQDSKVGDLGIPNDHATIELLIAISAIKVIRENKIAKVKIDWDLIRSDKGKKRGFNKRLNELNLTTEVPYTPFFENVLRAARDTTTTTIRPIISCFEENADILTPPH